MTGRQERRDDLARASGLGDWVTGREKGPVLTGAQMTGAVVVLVLLSLFAGFGMAFGGLGWVLAGLSIFGVAGIVLNYRVATSQTRAAPNRLDVYEHGLIAAQETGWEPLRFSECRLEVRKTSNGPALLKIHGVRGSAPITLNQRLVTTLTQPVLQGFAAAHALADGDASSAEDELPLMRIPLRNGVARAIWEASEERLDVIVAFSGTPDADDQNMAELRIVFGEILEHIAQDAFAFQLPAAAPAHYPVEITLTFPDDIDGPAIRGWLRDVLEADDSRLSNISVVVVSRAMMDGPDSPNPTL